MRYEQRRVRQTLLLQWILHWKSTTYLRGGDSGGVEYYDISGEGLEAYAELAITASTVKVLFDDGTYAYGPPMMWLISGTEVDMTMLTRVKAFAADPTTPLYGGVFPSPTPVREILGKELWDKMPKITKEEFYNALPK